jgi:2-methylcitrate dehydratase PrpD
LDVSRSYADYAIRNIIMLKFIPCGVNAQSAGECALRLHPIVKDRLDAIDRIVIKSHERMMRVLDKQGPLTNPADRDHCVQYVVAVLLIHGKIIPSDFSDDFAQDPRIDSLRGKMTVLEEPAFTRDFNDPEKRSNKQSIEIIFKDGSRTPEIAVEYPSGYPPLNESAFRMTETKFKAHIASHCSRDAQAAILRICTDQTRFEQTAVNDFMEYLAVKDHES